MGTSSFFYSGTIVLYPRSPGPELSNNIGGGDPPVSKTICLGHRTRPDRSKAPFLLNWSTDEKKFVLAIVNRFHFLFIVT